MDPPTSYTVRFLAGRTNVEVSKKTGNDDADLLQIRIDGKERATLPFDRFSVPGIAIGTEHIAVWSGCLMVVYAAVPDWSTSATFETPVLWAWPLSYHLCVVTEIEVVLWRPEMPGPGRQWSHDEIFTAAYWCDLGLVVQDLRNRRYRVIIDENRCLLKLDLLPS